jgi:hypothetical protein
MLFSLMMSSDSSVVEEKVCESRTILAIRTIQKKKNVFKQKSANLRKRCRLVETKTSARNNEGKIWQQRGVKTKMTISL